MKAIIYPRVSTKEQAEKGYSLEAQERECRKFAFDNGYEVAKVFVERGESAKTTDRTQLQKLIKYAVENKKQIDALIIWKYDRLARNLSDQMELVKHIGSLGIKVLSVTENNENNSVGKLMRNIISSFAQYENDVKSERTINGMKQALLNGRWCWRAHIGYKRETNTHGKSVLVPSEDAPFIQEAFHLAESGLYKQTDIIRELKRKGFKKLTEKRLNTVLRNPIYMGIIKAPRWIPEPIDGINKPLVSKETFSKIQLLLDGKRPRITPHHRNHPDFPLRNFIRCVKCGNKLTGSWSRGNKGIRYAYYSCYTTGCSLRIKKLDLEDNFYDKLSSIQPKTEILDLFEAIVLDVWKEKQSEQSKTARRIEQELGILKERKYRIEELMIKGTFDEETYKQKSEELRDEISIKQVELNETKVDLNNIEDCLSYCKYFLSNLAKIWTKTDVNVKQRFQNLIFPEKIYFENKTFRTTATASIFKQLEQLPANKSDLVAPTGFEPVFSA